MSRPATIACALCNCAYLYAYKMAEMRSEVMQLRDSVKNIRTTRQWCLKDLLVAAAVVTATLCNYLSDTTSVLFRCNTSNSASCC